MKAKYIVENNFELVEGTIVKLYKKYKNLLDIYKLEYDDVVQELILFFLEKGNSYNSKYKLSTYVYLIVNTGYLELLKHHKKIKRKSEINKIYDNAEEGNISFFDEYMFENMNVAYFELKDIMNKELDNREKEITLFLLKGYSVKEIAKYYDYTPQNISRIRKKIIQKLQKAI